MAKLKIKRSFIYKAYYFEGSEVTNNSHVGEFVFKSECHYYCEKAVLDIINNNQDGALKKQLQEDAKYLIYKICTLEDSNINDMLVEVINIDKDGNININ